MIVVASEDHKLHAPQFELGPSQFTPIFEKPERVDIVLSSLSKSGLVSLVEPENFDDEATLAVHDSSYLQFLASAYGEFQALGLEGNPMPCIWPRGSMRADSSSSIFARLGRYCFDGCVPLTETTYDAVIASRNIALTATQRVFEGERAVFALCRPPGHHAGPDYAGGYCFLNNAAIAAQWLRHSGAARVAILDIDYHHGNGTQEIFYGRSDVAFTSVHGDPQFEYPFYLGHADECGRGEGLGYNLNLPLPAATEFLRWHEAFVSAVNFIADFQAEYLVVSVGMDTFIDDPISSFCLQKDDYIKVGQHIAALGLPTVLVFEGGYAVAELGDNVAAFVQGLCE